MITNLAPNLQKEYTISTIELSRTKNAIFSDSHVLRHACEIGGSPENTLERQMLIKYAVSWNEIALALQLKGFFDESLEAFTSALQLYQFLNFKIHQTFILGDIFLNQALININ